MALPRKRPPAVFDDRNANGDRDAGDEPLSGSASSVYLDLNNDGWRDPSEPLATERTPGEYAFENVAPGTYPVRYSSAPSPGGAVLRERAQTFPGRRTG